MLEIVFVLVGTFVGAGFASGKEIFNFFTIYGYAGIFSVLLFSFFLFCLIFKCLKIKMNLKINHYYDFLVYLEQKHSFFNHKIFLLIINIFLASSFYIMVIALSSLFNYQFHIAKVITITTAIIICFFVFYKKEIHFIYMINSILMPLLIIFMLSLCIGNTNWTRLDTSFFISESSFFTSIFMGLLYFSYNSLLLVPILFDLKIEPSLKRNFNIAFLYSLIIFVLTFLLNLLLLSFFRYIYMLELPILYIANHSMKLFSYCYFFIFLSAIFTTMISSGYSFSRNFSEKHFTKKLLLFLLFSFVFCVFSFSSLINFFYPLFGFLGFVQIFLIFRDKT